MKKNALFLKLDDGQMCWFYFYYYLNYLCYVFLSFDLLGIFDLFLHEIYSFVAWLPWNCFDLSLAVSFVDPIYCPNPELISQTLPYYLPSLTGGHIQTQILDVFFILEMPQFISLAQISPQNSGSLYSAFCSHLHLDF